MSEMPTPRTDAVLDELTSIIICDDLPVSHRVSAVTQRLREHACKLEEEADALKARADALEALNATMHERISGLVADIAKYAGDVQELADIIIGGQCVPAPFSEVKRCALEMREDKARLDWLEDRGQAETFEDTPHSTAWFLVGKVGVTNIRTAIDAARAQTP